MSTRDVIRIPAYNDPDLRAEVIPALMCRYVAEVGPVPLGVNGPSEAHVLRWAWRIAAKAPVANEAPPSLTPGERLRSARAAAGLSSGALARELGYADHSSVSLVERGRAPLSQSMVAWLEGMGR